MLWLGSPFTGQDRYSIFREKILPALRAARKSLERLYCADNGRPAIDPVVLAGVSLLQFMETLSEDPTPKGKGEPMEQFLAEVTTTEAIASDIAGMERALQAQEEHGQEACQLTSAQEVVCG